MKKINWNTVGFIFIILVIFLFSHAVSFGFGRAYEKKQAEGRFPTRAQCMKYWAPLLTEHNK